MTLSAQDNVKLLDQLKSGFHRTKNWNKYQSKTSIQARNQYLVYLIAPSLQGVNWLFVLPFEDNAHRASYNRHFFPIIEKKDYNVIIDRKNLFWSTNKNCYRNIWQGNGKSQGDDYTIGCLLDYVYLKSLKNNSNGFK